MRSLISIFALIIVSYITVFSQQRIAVLPFYNMDGKEELNKFCYQLQDSLSKELIVNNKGDVKFYVVPNDSIELVLAEMNFDPNSPSYKDDLWKALEKLKCNKAVIGELQQQGSKLVVNASLCIVDLRLPIPAYSLRNLFVKPEEIYKVIPPICRKLLPGVLAQQ
jgi:TolB-like protein